MTSEERTAQIDRELDASLGVFDGELRREQGVIAQRRGARDGSGGSGGEAGSTEAEQAARNANASGGEKGEGDQPGKGSGGSNPKGGESGSGKDGEGNDSTGSGTRGGGGGYGGGARGGSGPSTVPADIPDGSDDDIVARQLREAAMQETDPELREKLWQEYRNYKKGAK
jgi:hypothetical protein